MNEDYPQQNTTYLRRPVRRSEEPQKEKKDRIKIWVGAAMVVFAFCVDLVEMLLEWLGIGILGLSTIISVCASLVFWIWFKMCSVEFVGSPKKFNTSLSTSSLEMIPGLDSLFGFVWTAGIIALVVMVRAEDKGGALGKIAGATQGKLAH